MQTNPRPSLATSKSQKPSLSSHKLVRARPLRSRSNRLALSVRSSAGSLGGLFLRFRRAKLRYKLVILATLAAIIGLAVWPRVNTKTYENTESEKSTIETRPTLQKGTPSYKTLLPTGKTAEQLGGWTRVSPPDRNPVYAYTDKIENIDIIVSQQPIPDDFKKDASKIKQFAQTYSAGHEITDGDTRIYSGVAEDGPESIIFSKNNLLIFIKADRALAESELISYIRSLQ